MLTNVRRTRTGDRRRGGVIFVTQLLDPTDPVLGFVVGLLPPLAARTDRLMVIANEIRNVPTNIEAEFETLGKEQGRRRLARTWRYESLLVRLSRDRSFAGLLAHMCPAYATLAAPALRPRRKRIALWFAHPANTRQLALAEHLSDVILTSLPGAYPRTTAKAIAIGQAIDTDLWRPREMGRRHGTVLRLLALGRTSSVKGYPVLIKAVRHALDRGLAVQLRVVGPATTPAEALHRGELVDLADRLDVSSAVEFSDGIPPTEVPRIVAESDVLVNATRAGSGDKAIFETMSAGRLVVVSNPAFAELLDGLPVELSYPDGDSDAMVDRFSAIANLSLIDRQSVGRQLRERIIRSHSLSSWSEAVVAAVNGDAASGGTSSKA
jgi:glycosyltransferase involved in cell wall biosynthesis